MVDVMVVSMGNEMVERKVVSMVEMMADSKGNKVVVS
jgi:hypothetical protein